MYCSFGQTSHSFRFTVINCSKLTIYHMYSTTCTRKKSLKVKLSLALRHNLISDHYLQDLCFSHFCQFKLQWLKIRTTVSSCLYLQVMFSLYTGAFFRFVPQKCYIILLIVCVLCFPFCGKIWLNIIVCVKVRTLWRNDVVSLPTWWKQSAKLMWAVQKVIAVAGFKSHSRSTEEADTTQVCLKPVQQDNSDREGRGTLHRGQL